MAQQGTQWNFAELHSIGAYRIIELLSSTPDRAIFRAHSEHSAAQVQVTLLTAVRLSSNIPLRDSANILRMRSSDMARFKHPNILTVLDAGECNGAPYIVHEISEGSALRKLLADGAQIPSEEILKYLAHTAAALDMAHSRNLFHGALRTDSIRIEQNGQARISDFGIEYILEPLITVQVANPEEELAYQLSFQPPERLTSRRRDRKGDLFSLAAVAFEALLGRLPTRSESLQETKDLVLRGFTAVVSELPSKAGVVFSRAFATPAQRFDSGHEFVCAMAEPLGIEPLTISFGASSTQTSDSRVQKEPKPTERTMAANSKIQFGFDSFRVTEGAPPKSRPGSAFLRSNEELKSNLSMFGVNRKFLVGGVVALVLAAVFCWLILWLPAVPSSPHQLTSVPEITVLGFDGLEAPTFDRAPEGTPIDAMSDSEIIGLIWSNSSSNALTIQALRVAKDRHIVALVNAAVKPLQHPEPSVRSTAARIVGEVGDRRIVPFVMALLDDPSAEVRSSAAQSLAVLGERKSVPFMIRKYLLESDQNTRILLKGAIDKLAGYAIAEAELEKIAE